MSLHNPSSLYTGGNVVFDNTPYLRMAMQQRLRKQALDEATSQYFTKLPEKLNTAGVRNVDMQDPNGYGGIQKDLDDWQTNFQLNKANILKGGMAQQKHLSDFERIRQKIQLSKDEGKKELLMGSQSLKPNGWRPRTHDHPIIENISKSIYDPTSYKEDGVTRYGLNDLSLAAAPYTADTELKHDKAITTGINTEKLPNDEGVRNPVTGNVTYNHGYTPEKIRQIGQNAIASITSDKTLYNHYEDLLDKPDQVEIASKALQEDYDRTHTDGLKVIVDTPEEMAAGLKMAQFKNTKIPKEANDYELREFNKKEAATLAFQRRKELANLNDRLIKGRKEDGTVDVSQVDYPTKILNEEYGEDVPTWNKSTGEPLGTKRVIYIDKIPVSLWRTINPKDINKGIYPIEGTPTLQEDKKTYRDAVYVDDENNIIGRYGKKIGAEDARNLFIKDVVPTKQKLQTVTNKPGTTKQATTTKKTVSGSTIKGLVGTKGYEGYTEQELIDYYKSNGYEIK